MPNYDMKYYQKQRSLLDAREEAANSLKLYKRRLQMAYGDPDEMDYWSRQITRTHHRLNYIHQELLPSQ